ncbi:MAG TPA: pantoate--beta-alanine ligase [Longimicrobiaceae bacterium]|nr:pantoate--beta-alanine ligase [Longimicrobiaceae bacterium]
MELARTVSEVRYAVAAARAAGERIGLVPTMGYLHDGHLSLIAAAKRTCSWVGLSSFVNPLQFGPAEDLSRYPRDMERDFALAESAGVAQLFAPSAAEMYPGGEPWVVVVPEHGSDRLCGASRPGHFRGVLTVVAKLIHIYSPDVAVFGQKDYQQLVLIRRMAEDLNMDITIEMAPIVRERDGLAMSSRNIYLSDDERTRALALSKALGRCEDLFRSGERVAANYRRTLAQAAGAGVQMEYGEVVDPNTLEPVDEVSEGVVCAIAARVGSTRLIDNVVLGSETFQE